MMGSGKSTVARALVRRLDWPLVDTDAAIEALCGRTIAAIFAAEGEPAFRRYERDVLSALDPHGLIVALGGGAVVAHESRALALARGWLVWLDATPEVLARRTAGDARPLLAGLDMPERAARLGELARERRDAYAIAALRVDTAGRSAAEIADSILEAHAAASARA